MSPHINLDMDRIKEFCRRWGITQLALFGSVLRDDFRPDSDEDVLVTSAPDSPVTLFTLGNCADELSDILGRQVDLTDRRGVEQSHNRIRRKHIFSHSETVYVA